jgi:hypothetical protein
VWVTGTAYAAGIYVTDPIDGAVYYSTSAVTSAAPPSTDPANWSNYSGPVAPLYLGIVTSDSPDFIVTSQPFPVIQPGHSTTFTVRINTGTMMQKVAVISIPNSTSTNPFVVHLTGAVLGVTTYQGNIKWYGFMPFDYVAGVSVPEYYLTKSASGLNSQVQAAGAPDGSNSMGTIDVVNIGGSVHVNFMTGAITGTMMATWVYTGVLCQGSSYAYMANPLYINKTSSNLYALLAFYSAVGIGHLKRKYMTGDFPSPGYHITYCDNGIWGTPGDVAIETLLNKNNLANAVAAGGAATIAPVLKSSTTSYNSGTGAQVGTATTVHVIAPAASVTGKAVLTAYYSQQLIGGGPVTYFTDANVYDVGVGNPLDVTFDIPMITGYVVTMLSYTVEDVDTREDDFEDQVAKWFGGVANSYLPPITWTDFPTFEMMLPGTMCASDWEQSTPGWLSYDVSGDYWASTGTFDARDYWEVSDDFEVYAAGTIYFEDRGLGWAMPGVFSLEPYLAAFDDFESYAAGTLALLDYGTYNFTNQNFWSTDGTFLVADYSVADDNFGYYPAGIIILLSLGDGDWTADGTFLI